VKRKVKKPQIQKTDFFLSKRFFERLDQFISKERYLKDRPIPGKQRVEGKLALDRFLNGWKNRRSDGIVR
jgi:hypothetical protein